VREREGEEGEGDTMHDSRKKLLNTLMHGFCKFFCKRSVLSKSLVMRIMGCTIVHDFNDAVFKKEWVLWVNKEVYLNRI
jgi:hypothetical protein